MSIESHRKLEQVIPDAVQKWWDKWELRGLILISLVSHIILTILGDRRKWKPNILTKPLLWSAYMLADWVATVAMGVISSNLGDIYNKGEHPKNVDPQLLAFWATFFLIHRGGPDTITAYSLEDNELWLRQFISLLSQTTLTVYVIVLSWEGNWLSHLTIPMLIVGIIKYGERTWSLYCGSIKYLRDSFLRSSDYSVRREQQELVSDFFVTKEQRRGFFRAINIFISLFVDMVLSPSDIIGDREAFQPGFDFSKWKIVDFELKLMYDVFYSKTFANYGIRGLISRFINLTTSIVVLVFYTNLSEMREYLDVDHIITYLLVIGALLEDIYAFMLVLSSEWTVVYLEFMFPDPNKHLNFVSNCQFFCCLGWYCCFRQLSDLVRYITPNEVVPAEIFIRQSNLLNLISNKSSNIKGNFFLVNKLEELTSVREYCVSSNDLQKVVYRRFFDKSKEATQSNPSSNLAYMNLLLEKNVPIFVRELELHRTIITWHVVTDMLYYYEDDSGSKSDKRKNCKVMSDYMFYLLVKQRQMLPVGAGLITLQDTITEAKNIIAVPQDNLAQMSRTLLQHDTTRARDEVSDMQNTSVLLHACAVAKQLLAEENRQLTWKFVEDLWIEIMCYASAQCRVDRHAHHLRRGPEFVSHVWLLQAHLGLFDQFQITPRQASV
ncbi:hypothetical protein Fmac_028994 [Flemingia macrophylla]|uniref:DUF4220 domain-containing protein n=1 Tax=Flemingia macrophylla TaxID=520843 RepID=A0ABD1L933_9FABA